MARLIALVLFSILSFVARADAPATPVEYSQDWEGDEFEVLSGWLAYIDAFDPDCTTTGATVTPTPLVLDRWL